MSDNFTGGPTPNYVAQERRTAPLLQGDSELIYSFSQPDAKEYDKDFEHINKDYRMANLNDGDIEFLDAASVAMRMGQGFLGQNAQCVKTLQHDTFVMLNSSVAYKGRAMELLVTRKNVQHDTLVRDSRSVFNNKREEEQ